MQHTHSRTIFPPIKFLTLFSAGLDISDRSIKFVELARTSAGLRLRHFGEKLIPMGLIQGGEIVQAGQMQTLLEMFQTEHNLGLVRVSLPEEKIYIFSLKLPKLNRRELRSAIELQIDKNIPLLASEAVFDFLVAGEEGNNFEVQVVAIPKTLADNHLAVLIGAGLYPIAFELEAQAIARAVIAHDDINSYMLVDLGETRTGIAIVNKGVTYFSSTIPIGGAILTKTIEKSLKVDYLEAERLKREMGMHQGPDNRNLFNLLLNSISILRDEINKNYIYWHNYNKDPKKKIAKIILCGGNANLVGLVEYLSISIRAKVELANVWMNIDTFENYIPAMTYDQSLSYATAIGLALGNWDHD